MKKIFLSTIVAIFVLGTLSPVEAAGTTVNFNLPSSRAIPKKINGVNQNFFVESFREYDSATKKWVDKEYNFSRDAFDQTGTNLVRFPGGTVANYYNWETFAPDWVAGEAIQQTHGNHVAWITRYFDAFVGHLDPIFFIKTIQGKGKDVILTLNVYSNTPEQIEIGLKKLKAANITVRYFELGNEMYFYTPAQEYVNTSRRVALKIKSIYPNAQIGIVGNRSDWSGEQFDWEIPNADWFDAVIYHPYSGNGKQLQTEQLRIQYILFGIPEKISSFIAKMRDKYPNKALWFTEWNLYEVTNDGTIFYTDTYAYAAYHYNVLLTLLKYPKIAIANHHTTWTRSPQFALLYAKKAINDSYYSKLVNPPNNVYSLDDFFVKSPAFWPFSWIGRAFNTYHKFTLVDNETVTSAYFFNADQPNQGSVAIINKTGVDQTITLNGIGTQSHTAFVLAKEWMAQNSETNQMHPEERTLPGTTITLKPYAIAYIVPLTQIIGDLNGDTKVDMLDYAILIADFGKTGTPGWVPADIDKSGKVDVFDYNILVGNFGK
jgi:hypothetical protein